MKKVLIIDHYDSFSYNLQQYCKDLGAQVEVIKCDDEILKGRDSRSAVPTNYTHIILSPGPGSVYKKGDIGYSAKVLQERLSQMPILGVCLGHQLLAAQAGAQIIQTEPQHGKKVDIEILSDRGLFTGIKGPIKGMRYHSQAINVEDIGVLGKEGWEITARAIEDDQIMAIEHHEKKAYGVQFHPESIGTEVGMQILWNFLKSQSPHKKDAL